MHNLTEINGGVPYQESCDPAKESVEIPTDEASNRLGLIPKCLIVTALLYVVPSPGFIWIFEVRPFRILVIALMFVFFARELVKGRINIRFSRPDIYLFGCFLSWSCSQAFSGPNSAMRQQDILSI
jgi:hypothetical protein